MRIVAVSIRRCCAVLFAAALLACGGGDKEQTAEAPPVAEAPHGAARTLPIPTQPQARQAHDASLGAGAAGRLEPPPPDSGTGNAGLEWTSPAGWQSVQPANSMRRAQYKVPGPGGEAECVVFYFGPGQGGDPLSNAQRWAGQFKTPDGKSVDHLMKTTQYAVGPIKVLEVEVTGTYDGGQTMTAEPPKPQPGSMMLGAVAEGPDANWFFKFIGPEATVREQRPAFEGMIRSLKTGA